MDLQLVQTTLKRKKNRLILSNGSERGDFVPISHIFSEFSKIHDGIQLMKTYYPHDEIWSTKSRVSNFTNKKNVTYVWDYEYDDYHPFDIFDDNGSTLGEMEQIKYYGSDIYLTLTLDISLSDKVLKRIVESLVPFGRVFLRINHEANGSWFTHNLQYTYQEVSSFFVRFHKIIKNNSSTIFTVFSLTSDVFVNDGLVLDSNLKLPNCLKEALNIADYWSIDKYATLNHCWPFAEKLAEGTYFKGTVDDWWRLVEETYLKMIWHNNMIAKPLFINEFNSDSDVDGYEGQASIISDIYNRLSKGEFEWLAGIALYQFRDYGGLGLENGTLDKYKQLPSLIAYKEALHKFGYSLVCDSHEWIQQDYTFYWPNPDNIRGIKTTGISGNKHFINQFPFPVYIVYGEKQLWARLEKDETFNLNEINELLLLVPPYKDTNGNIRDSITIRNIKETLLNCFFPK